MTFIPIIKRKRSSGAEFTRLALASIVASGDPGTRLAAPITDSGEGVGLQFQLTGGWTSADWAGAWPFLVWELTGDDGVAIGTDDQFCANVVARIRTHPGDASDANLYVAIVNETDLTSGTIDGVAGGIRWTGAARNTISTTTVNGATAGTTAGGGVAGAEALQSSIPRQGKGASSILVAGRIGLLDGTGAPIGGSIVNVAPGSGVAMGNPSKLYVAVAAGRSAATAGTVTIGADMYINRPRHAALPGF